MTQAKAYVCIDAAGTVAGGCIVVDQANARHVIRTWLRLRSGCRVESVAIEKAYQLMRSPSPRRRRPTKSRVEPVAHVTAHR
jgi:hypothetical protein